MNKMEAKTEEYAALIGLDWASMKHDICIRDAATGEIRFQVINHTPEALAEWLCELQTRYPGRRLALCLEQKRGALIYALVGHAFLDLYPINPASLAKYRQAFKPSRAKDDPTDARLLEEILCLHRDKLEIWRPDEPQTRLLGFLNEERRKAVNLRTKLVLRLQAALSLYFPQALEWVGEYLHAPLACDWLMKWPTLEAIKEAKPQVIRAFYYAHNNRRADLVTGIIAAIAAARPLTRDAPVIEANQLTVHMLAKQLRFLHSAIQEYDKRIERLFKQHPDAYLFESLPGAGPVLAPRLLSAFGPNRARHPDARSMQAYAGIAPVIERSGKSCWTHWRWNCPKFLRQTFHEFAKNSIPKSAWAHAFYELQKSRGKGHNAAIRSLAFKWVRIIHTCWQTRTPYDEQLYMQRLEQRGSPLVGLVAASTRVA